MIDIAAAAFRLHRRDAELLHALGELRAERERSAQQEEQIAALQQERAVAAESIVQLCNVVHAQQTRAARASGDVMGRFSWN